MNIHNRHKNPFPVGFFSPVNTPNRNTKLISVIGRAPPHQGCVTPLILPPSHLPREGGGGGKGKYQRRHIQEVFTMLMFPSSCAWLFLRAAAAAAATDVSVCTHTPRVDRLMHMDLGIYHLLFPYYMCGTGRLGAVDGLQELYADMMFSRSAKQVFP